jgi:hypothetical protein
MLAMIVLDTKEKKLLIIHDAKGKVKLVASDAAAEKYVSTHIPNGKLLGTFPDPSELVDIVLKETKQEARMPHDKEDKVSSRKSGSKGR